ncbi:transposase family protein [Microcoleus sp. AT9_B5]
MSSLAIVAAFSGLPDARRGAGRRHDQALCIALFTLAISAGCRGFLSISDWLKGYRRELLELFSPAKSRLPSYSTIRRVLLNIDYEAYSRCLADFFVIEPLAGETIAMDGKVLRGSYNLDTPALARRNLIRPRQLVTVYVVERGLMRADSTCGL